MKRTFSPVRDVQRTVCRVSCLVLCAVCRVSCVVLCAVCSVPYAVCRAPCAVCVPCLVVLCVCVLVHVVCGIDWCGTPVDITQVSSSELNNNRNLVETSDGHARDGKVGLKTLGKEMRRYQHPQKIEKKKS